MYGLELNFHWPDPEDWQVGYESPITRNWDCLGEGVRAYVDGLLLEVVTPPLEYGETKELADLILAKAKLNGLAAGGNEGVTGGAFQVNVGIRNRAAVQRRIFSLLFAYPYFAYAFAHPVYTRSCIGGGKCVRNGDFEFMTHKGYEFYIRPGRKEDQTLEVRFFRGTDNIEILGDYLTISDCLGRAMLRIPPHKKSVPLNLRPHHEAAVVDNLAWLLSCNDLPDMGGLWRENVRQRFEYARAGHRVLV